MAPDLAEALVEIRAAEGVVVELLLQADGGDYSAAQRATAHRLAVELLDSVRTVREAFGILGEAS